MALIVEDGTGVEDAESYISVDDADVELAKRGSYSDWDGLTTVNKEIQLRLATEYVDREYLFIGCRTSSNQELEWPRQGTKYDANVIPSILKRAVAVLAAQSVLLPLYVTESAGGQVKRTKDKLDVLETSVEYFEYGGNDQTAFVEVKNMLKPITEGLSAYRG